jgi:hypothetical protein
MNWPKRLIMKYLFLTSEVTYYKYDRIAKDIITKAFKSE